MRNQHIICRHGSGLWYTTGVYPEEGCTMRTLYPLLAAPAQPIECILLGFEAYLAD